MSKRSTKQQKIDDNAFPVRIVVIVPPSGFGTLLSDMVKWLDQHVGRGKYALHSAGRRVVDNGIADTTAFFFVSPRAAAEFFEAFPIQLADGTTSVSYFSPGMMPDNLLSPDSGTPNRTPQA